MLPLDEPFYSLHAVSRFRQEAREQWDNFVCDNVVYTPEEGEFDPLAESGYLEQYLSGDIWFEILFGFRAAGYLHTYCAVLEFLDASATTGEGGNAKAGRYGREQAVLVGIPQEMKNPQGVILRGIPSVIRLNGLDDPKSIGQNVLGQAIEVLDAGPACVGKDGEGRLLVRLISLQESQLPSDVIQGRAQIMSNVTKDDGKLVGGRRLWRELVNEIRIITRIELTSRSVGVLLDESRSSIFEFFKVFTRPLCLEPRTRDVGHEVYSTHGEEADDSEGTRNPHTDARRVHSQSGKDCEEAEALNSSTPPEEVVPGTGPVLRLGGCNATRTRSGSPEDA